MSGARFHFLDLVDLALMTLARRRRRALRDEEGLQDFYEEFFTPVDECVLASGEDRRKAVRLHAVRAAVERHGRGGRLLDVGCGCGDTLAALSGLPGWELHGLEFSERTLERAERVLHGRAQLQQGSAMDLPFPAGTFDAITCVEVLEHLRDDSRALAEFRRVLRPGGLLVLTVPYRHWFPAYLRFIGHERHYTRSSITDRLCGTGFQAMEFLPNLPRWHRVADYAYAACRLIGLLAGRFGGVSEPHRVRLPGAKKPLLLWLWGRLEPLRRADERLRYEYIETSTSIAAVSASLEHVTLQTGRPARTQCV